MRGSSTARTAHSFNNTMPTDPVTPLLSIKSIYLHPRDDSRMWGAWIDLPQADTTRDAYSLSIVGWVLSRGARAVAVEYLHAGTVLGRGPVNIDRPDLVAAFPEAQDALKSGFRVSFSTVKLPCVADIFVQAVLADEARVPICVISIERQPIATTYKPQLQPLIISTLGRTGSTWVARVLGEHPQIAAYRPFEYEPRLASYWLEMLRTTAEPCSYYQALDGELYGDTWWLGTRRQTPPPAQLLDPNITRWWARDNVEAVARFAMERIDSFYSEVARMQGKPDAVFFTEKCWPGTYVPQALAELYPRGREVILVRDFRDMVCSILSFNKKLGYASFGRELTDTDEKFIRQTRVSAVRTLEHWRGRGKAAHLLRYEDLILRPEATLREVLGYLGLDAGDDAIAATLARAHALTPSLQKGHQTSKDPAASIGRWRSDLDDKLKAVCNDAFGDVLAQMGYDL